jgi:hypothetical protein
VAAPGAAPLISHAPADALACTQADQRGADRRQHRDPHRRHVSLCRPHQVDGADGAAGFILIGHARADANRIVRQLRRWHEARALEFLQQLCSHLGQAVAARRQRLQAVVCIEIDQQRRLGGSCRLVVAARIAGGGSRQVGHHALRSDARRQAVGAEKRGGETVVRAPGSGTMPDDAGPGVQEPATKCPARCSQRRYA